MLETLTRLLENDAIHDLMSNYTWAWPICEMLHFFGMALLIGTVGVLDLRMLGVAKALPVRALERVIPWGIAGFTIVIITGYMFVAGAPGGPPEHLLNLAFQLKMLLIALAGVNVAVFYLTGLSHAADQAGPGEDVPRGAKAVAVTSLVLWLGVIYFGRMIMYSDAFYVREYFSF